MSIVLDTSMALSWFFHDEQTDANRKILDAVAATGAVVPAIWRLEIANALQASVRRRRIDTTFRDAALARLTALSIAVDTETDHRAWSATLHLADRFGLTAYDAAYLELACRLRLPLATLDVALAAAARQSDLQVLGGT